MLRYIPKKYPTKEDSEISPKYPYALSKNMGEQLILHYSELYKLSTTSLRLLTFTAQEQERQELMEPSLEFF